MVVERVEIHKMLWNRIQSQLNQKEMSIYRLSKITGIPDNTLYGYKNNGVEPSFSNMVKIADALDVSLDVFRKVKL